MKSKLIFILVGLLVIAGIAWFSFAAYVWFTRTNTTYTLSPEGKVEEVPEVKEPATSTESVVIPTKGPGLFSGVELEIASLQSPRDFAILPDTGFLVLDNNKLALHHATNDPVFIEGLPKVTIYGDGGLVSVAIDDKFVDNQIIYLVYTYRNDSGFVFNRLSSFKLNTRLLTSPTESASTTVDLSPTQISLGEEKIIIDNIPAGTTNNGGQVVVGPDKMLWLLTGDTGKAVFSQNPESLAGKVLRIGKDGSIPVDNPWSGLPTYALGFRDPRGLVFLDKEVYVVDAGGTAYDEINKVVAKGNYGWPVVGECFTDDQIFINPIICSGKSAWKPVGLGVGQNGDLLVGSLAGKNILQITKSATSTFDTVKSVAGGYVNLRKVKSVGDWLVILFGDKVVGVKTP